MIAYVNIKQENIWEKIYKCEYINIFRTLYAQQKQQLKKNPPSCIRFGTALGANLEGEVHVEALLDLRVQSSGDLWRRVLSHREEVGHLTHIVADGHLEGRGASRFYKLSDSSVPFYLVYYL